MEWRVNADRVQPLDVSRRNDVNLEGLQDLVSNEAARMLRPASEARMRERLRTVDDSLMPPLRSR